MLDFQIGEILLADSVWRAQTHYHAKCRQNRSTEILQFFGFSRWPPPPSWNFEIAKFYGLLGCRGSRFISIPNFVKICQSVANILRFFDYSRWRPPPSWIFEIVNFLVLTVSRVHKRITVSNFVKIGRSFAEILRFFKFSRWPTPPSWNFEIAKFYWL